VIAIDTSAILAILYREPEYDEFVDIMIENDRCFLSAVSYFEASLVLVGRGVPEVVAELDAFVGRTNVEVVPFDYELATRAREAFLRFGRGRHPASLNLGDCVSYALAQTRELPLLYKGEDFVRTDVIKAALSRR
jgi:ribonuclease VapC